MENDYRLFWTETVRQLLKDDSVSQQEYDMWFQNMHFISGEDSVITLNVPSKFYRDQVSQRYVSLLESKLKELSGSPLNLAFQIAENSQQTETADEPEQSPQTSGAKKPQTKAPAKREPHKLLRPEYTFERFIIGSNNQFAANAAQAIGGNPGGEYNPFLIYGGVGLGKTHLMQAVGNAIHQNLTDKKVRYITAESFINEFIYSIRSETQSQFKNKYRKIDVLLIDDIHDLQKAKETQEELFHTFNALYDANKQLIFTCDRPPSELRNFTDRLKSRFERGLNVDLQPPNFETRSAILRKKLEFLKVPVPDEVIDLIARNVTTNVRDLEASLTKMAAYADLVGKDVTVEVAMKHLKGTFASNLPMNISIDKVQRVVSDYFNVTLTDLKSKKRTKQVTFPRQIAMFIIRDLTDYSTTEIGLEFGGRDHSTVMHACQRIEDRMKSDPTLEPTIGELKRSIKENG